MPGEPATPESDLRLVQLVLAGDSEALDRFVERMRCVARILAAHNVQLGRPLDDHDLADLAQDTLIVVWRKLGEFEGRSELTGWVYRICVLQLMNAARRKQRRRVVGLDAASDATYEAAGGSGSQHEDLYLGLERVPENEALIIRLKHFEDLPFEVVAERLGEPTSSVKSRYYRGIARLSEFLRNRGEGAVR